MNRQYDRYAARKAASVIAQAAQRAVASPLKRIFLFGAIAEGRPDSVINLILEVDLDTFDRYATRCMVDLDGVHPFSDGLLRLHDGLWDHCSPKRDRSAVAVDMIGVNLETLDLGVSKEALNIVCLPEGWNEGTTVAHQELQNVLKGDKDPHFLDNLVASSVPSAPLVCV